MIQNLKGKYFGKYPKLSKTPKIIIMGQLLLVKWNHEVLLWCVVKMKHFIIQEIARDTW